MLDGEHFTTKNAVSLSARRAWIEIFIGSNSPIFYTVALRKESVDRNLKDTAKLRKPTMSLSARRAWIEIDAELNAQNKTPPSLSARRAWIEIIIPP